MQPVKQLVRIKHGSNLYGTSTPSSDTDWKGVHLPSGEGILLGRAEDVINTSVVSKDGTKNTKDAIDSDSYSLQKFFEMLMKGDTVATEILFADYEMDECWDPEWANVQAVGKKLLNRQCKGFVGYCVRQAAKYGIKGSRMAAVRGVLDRLELLQIGRTTTAKLSVIEDQLRMWSQGRDHVSWENIPNPNGTDNWHLNVCDRKMPMTAHISEAAKVYQKVWDNYGERARSAMNNEGIDWKAMSHAVRVAGQAIELLTTGHITFPRPDAPWLLEIKQGLVPYATVSDLLELLVARVQECSLTSQLPEKSDPALADELVKRLYLEQITG